MTARQIIKRFADFPVSALHPINTVDNSVLNDAAGVVGCAFKVYDPGKDSVISADEASGQMLLSVAGAGNFVVGDTVEITQDDGVLHAAAIDSVDAAGGTVTIDVGLTDSAAAGNRIRVIFGVSVAMLEFGTANINTLSWGYRASLADTHVVYDDTRAKTGLDANIEIRFNGGAGLAAFDVICITITEDDCL